MLARHTLSAGSSSAVVFDQGSHVASCVLENGPLLFLSRQSGFTAGQPIRGGVPLVAPWFGPRPGDVAHGPVRRVPWALVREDRDSIAFRVPPGLMPAPWQSLALETRIELDGGLEIELEVSLPEGALGDVTVEVLFHTYLAVPDVREVAIQGLRGVSFLDQLSGDDAIDDADTVTFAGEVDRVYRAAPSPIDVVAPGRVVARVESLGCSSTVVWNPWIDKSRRMADLGDDEYLRFVCVESGCVGPDAIRLRPGESRTVAIRLTQP